MFRVTRKMFRVTREMFRMTREKCNDKEKPTARLLLKMHSAHDFGLILSLAMTDQWQGHPTSTFPQC